MTVNTQELRELLEKASPRPWTWKQVGTFSTPGVALFWPDSSKGGVHYRRLDSNGGMTEADADLITNAVRALPALLAENEALRAELQARQWMPIETAPHDQEVLLGWYERDGAWKAEVGMASWGWRTTRVNNISLHGRATHWQTLPPAPPQGETA
ncbi:hypothetical protein CAL18_12595 [Bordetella genomosp. 7]|uniref:hypothetical protein n=1 Tax=Bordetella genomosp. 7 TaxID=1416805 RepID=UPI000B9E4B9F|nr:hypothetical protein [Bordetella genomosp. 7]OZI21756.1 hypothetical protein CAL18_12595 [Bordetella genomosp. 7]